MNLMLSEENVEQSPLLPPGDNELTVVVAGLAIGGAERIILDWAIRIYPRFRAHIIVLRDCNREWPVPDFIKITRLHGKEVIIKLEKLAAEIAAGDNPVCLCHLLVESEREAFSRKGVFVIPVLHNARDGWLENISCLRDLPCVVAVSEACGNDLRDSGFRGTPLVIRHIPPAIKFAPGSRERFRKLWNIPSDATVIGMIGAVKPQKNYPFALRVLYTMLQKRDVYLVIVGGPVGRNGRLAWEMVLEEMRRLNLRSKVAMPGFVPDAVNCLLAFDALLNTSHYEGLSIATLEALVNGLPVVASRVGGQGEIGHEGLKLISKDAPEEIWVRALEEVFRFKTNVPSWARFPAYRLWTLVQLARPVKDSGKVLFVTANLNSGGAQRSLVNLAGALKRKIKFEIVVTGNSTASYFFRKLKQLGVRVSRTADSKDAFDHAEMLVKKICSDAFSTVCFWNLDPKIKLLLVKTLGFTQVRFMDISPGHYSFNEMADTADFQQLICFSEKEYYSRLDKLVLKYNGFVPFGCEEKTVIIPNCISASKKIKIDYAIRGAPRVAVGGRIAPTKFIEEIIEAIRLLWGKIPTAEMHVFGAV
ncbi:MAG: glycosyltransferase, partial [bacterium]|nr:glycosyltransferase [bacterium]